ncbi:MAG: pyridoxamine 5'-phosphate oxidase family protein [Chloroflexota bacterium]
MARNYNLDSNPPTAHQRLPEYSREEDWIRAFLRDAKVAHIATSRDGQPFVNPTNFWLDEEHDQIVFHSNVAGRLRSNIEANPEVCLEASEMGKFLPSNVALEFSVQFRSVVVFGAARLVTEPVEARHVLYGLIHKYFPEMSAGREFRGITDKELRATSVYAIAIEAWSGKENWKDRADQSDEWPALDEKWFD